MFRKAAGGFTCIEGLAAASVILMVLGLVSPLLIASRDARRRSTALLAVQAIARDLAGRSGNPAPGKDPWGHAYLCLGGRSMEQAAGTPLFILSAGPDGSIDPANDNAGKGPAGGAWSRAGASRDDVVITLR